MTTNTKWYMDSVKYAAVTQWATLTAKTVGQIVRQTSPTVGNERCFICIIAGTTLVGEPTWVITKGAKTAEAAGPTWQECSGRPAVNGDATNTPTWALGPKGVAVALGEIIKDNAGTHFLICSTAGTAGSGSEPSWDFGALGNTTADNTVTWTYIGLVSSFSTIWAAPFARLRIPWAASSPFTAAGDDLYEGNTHAATEAADTTALSPGTPTLPCRLICVDNSAAPPTAVATGGSESTTGAANSLHIKGIAYIYGTVFSACGGGVNNGSMDIGGGSNPVCLVLDTCDIIFAGTHPSGAIVLGTTSGGAVASYVELRNCRAKLSNASHAINLDAIGKIRGLSFISGNTMSTTMFGSQLWAVWDCKGIDFTNAPAAGNLFNNAPNGNVSCLITFSSCLMPATWSGDVTPAAITYGGLEVVAREMSTADNALYYKKINSQGTIVQETATFVRTGGAAYPNSVSGGTNPQPYAWKFVSSARCQFPGVILESAPLTVGALCTGAKSVGSSMTITVPILFDSASELNNDDLGLIVVVLSTSGKVLGTLANSFKATVLTAAATLSSLYGSSSGWGTSGMSNAKQRNLGITFTPTEISNLGVMVVCAKASLTFYVDPKPIVT